MKIKTIGSSSKGNMFVVYRNKDTIIIDAGIKTEIEADILAITHKHIDHIKYIEHYIDRVKHFTTSEDVLESLEERINAYTFQKILEKYKPPFMLFMEDVEMVHDVPTCGFIIYDEEESYMHITDTVEIPVNVKTIGHDYYTIEANHDVEMLMQTDRPEYLKQRIMNSGHLSNHKALEYIKKIVTENTKQINLVHISAEANLELSIQFMFIEYNIVINGEMGSLKRKE